MKTNCLSWLNNFHRELVLRSLRHDELVISSTDTVLGLLGSVSRPSFLKLNALKHRFDKPYIILIDDVARLPSIAELCPTDPRYGFLARCWPGPVTVILRACRLLPPFLLSPDHTIAVRVPDHTGLQAILAQLPGLFSTSANRAGQPTPTSLLDIDKSLLAQVSYVILDSEKNLEENPENRPLIGLPSTVLDLTGAVPRVMRQGAYPVRELERLWGTSFD